jgi:C4-dicarboxylate-specific signal transduction histidine kinase
MKNLSIFTQIVIINTIVMAFFIGIFIFKNYTIVSNQLILLEDEKINSIAKSLTPIISINMSLGLEDNLKGIIKNGMQIHKEIKGVEVIDNNKHIIFENLNNEKTDSNIKVYKIELKDSILKTPIGEMKVYYTFSDISEKLLTEFSIFLFWMLFFFLFSLLISTLLIRYNLKSLQRLKDKMLNYSLNKKTIFQEESSKNELSVINNSAIKMIKKIEEEVDKRILYEKDIMQKNRLASMGEMIDNIAHQWRQPLMKINAILLNTDRAIELKKYDEKYLQTKIDEISNTVYFMSNTIDTFREFLNPNKTKQHFEIKESIEKSIEFLSSSLENTEVKLESKEYLVEASQSEFMQVIISMLSNAVDIFEVKKIKNQKIDISIYEDEVNIFIEILDNAGGIEEENLYKVFDPYFTTKHKQGGTGMGLYIAKIIMINSFNGDISVQNEANGARFTLKILKETSK